MMLRNKTPYSQQELVNMSPLMSEAATETAKRYLAEVRRLDYRTQDVPESVMTLVMHYFAAELLYQLENDPVEITRQFSTEFATSLNTVRESLAKKVCHFRVIECTLDSEGKWQPGNPVNEEIYLERPQEVIDLWNAENETPETVRFEVLEVIPRNEEF